MPSASPRRRPSTRAAALAVAVGAVALAVSVWRARSPEPRARVAPPQAQDPASRSAPLARAPGPHALRDGGVVVVSLTSARPLGHPLGVRPAPVYRSRPDGEWDGMRVDLSALQAYCERPDGCGAAMACVGGACRPCERDAECTRGEACVLDHCVAAEGVGCRTRRDCAPDALCVLSGYGDGVRGNEGMRAYCARPEGPSERASRPDREAPVDEQRRPAAPRTVAVEDLIEEARRVAANP
jgi:hypothetical protein